MPLSEEDAVDIRGSLAGDADAYRRLVDRYEADVGRLMWRFSRDRRVWEELVQDVFVETYRSLAHFRGEAAFRTWLSRIATRVGYRHWKRQRRDQQFVPFEPEMPEAAVEAEPAAGPSPQAAAAMVHRLLEQLPPRDRLVLTLMYMEEMDVAGIAERTGWSRTMVKVQAHRARTKLRKIVEQSELREELTWIH